jgi:hypothetical protein
MDIHFVVGRIDDAEMMDIHFAHFVADALLLDWKNVR